MCLLEAMSFGLPIVASDVGDIKEAIVHLKNGYLIKPGDYKSLALKIQQMINLDEVQWNNMRDESLNIIKQKFSEEDFFEILQNIYEQRKNKTTILKN